MCVRFCMSTAQIGCFLDRAPTYDKVHRWVSGLPYLDDDFHNFARAHVLGADLTCRHGLFRERILYNVYNMYDTYSTCYR